MLDLLASCFVGAERSAIPELAQQTERVPKESSIHSRHEFADHMRHTLCLRHKTSITSIKGGAGRGGAGWGGVGR